MKIIYRAFDGTEFQSQDECEKYEFKYCGIIGLTGYLEENISISIDDIEDNSYVIYIDSVDAIKTAQELGLKWVENVGLYIYLCDDWVHMTEITTRITDILSQRQSKL